MNENRRVRAIAVGASAGGVESLTQWVSLLDPKIQCPIFVVMHFPQAATSALPQILSRAGKLPAKHPRDREIPLSGTIYIAPPGKHMLLRLGAVRLSNGPNQNGGRTAIDPLFRSVARAYGSNSMGLLLSGMLKDGTRGMACISACGGVTAVQDPDQALFGDMSRNAMQAVSIDYVLRIEELAALTNALGTIMDP